MEKTKLVVTYYAKKYTWMQHLDVVQSDSESVSKNKSSEKKKMTFWRKKLCEC